MVKVKKTYRLNNGTVEQIQALKEFYSERGLNLSDSQIIERAVSMAMDSRLDLSHSDGDWFTDV